MATRPYLNKKGKRVPGVTTVLSRFKESGALLYWAWSQGKEGKDFRDTRDAAASAGTLAHLMVECHIRKKPFPEVDGHSDDVYSKACQAFETYLEWANQTKLEAAETEVSLVSDRYDFGGTLDAILIQGKLAIGDWKTSNGVYTDYLLQIAAYGILWEENRLEQPITGGYHLLRFSKEEADFGHYYWSQLEDAKKMFLLLREAYDLDKKLKERLG